MSENLLPTYPLETNLMAPVIEKTKGEINLPSLNPDFANRSRKYHDEKLKDDSLDSKLTEEMIHLANYIIQCSVYEAEALSSSFKIYLVEKLMSVVRCAIYTPNEFIAQRKHKPVPVTFKSSKNKDDFLDKVIILIESNLDDETFNMNTICKSLCMSRTNLYNKIKQKTGKSIRDFIRTIRLKKAAYLLIHERLNVTEVMYRVGITSPSYFTRFFKKEYGVPPSHFAKKFQPQVSEICIQEN